MTTEMQKLRETRNKMLEDSDWTVMPDSPFSDSKQADWKTYRQALRNLPSTAEPQLDENGKLTNVTWPTKPS